MTNDKPISVEALRESVTAKCCGFELKAAGMPESMVEFAAALEHFAIWAYHKGLARASAEYEAKDKARRQQDAQLLASIRQLVERKR